MRPVLFALALSLSGCQCLVPVPETPEPPKPPDGGTVSGAGLDAGRAECRAAADCPQVSAPRACAFAGPAPARSCVDGRCVFDCEGARSCTTRTGSCLSCDGGAPSCTTNLCGWLNSGTTGRVYRTCDAGVSDALGDFRAAYRQAATCNFELFFPDGGLFGGLDLVGDERSSTATVKGEPGVTCTVRGLATALNRMELGCAQCMYIVEWP